MLDRIIESEFTETIEKQIAMLYAQKVTLVDFLKKVCLFTIYGEL